MKNNKGFSLVELIVVIAIMAILAAVAVIGVSVYIPKAQQASDKQLIADIEDILTYEGYAGTFEDGDSGFIVLSKDNDARVQGDALIEALTNAYGTEYAKELKLAYDEWGNNGLLSGFNSEMAWGVANSSFMSGNRSDKLLTDVEKMTGVANHLASMVDGATGASSVTAMFTKDGVCAIDKTAEKYGISRDGYATWEEWAAATNNQATYSNLLVLTAADESAAAVKDGNDENMSDASKVIIEFSSYYAFAAKNDAFAEEFDTMMNNLSEIDDLSEGSQWFSDLKTKADSYGYSANYDGSELAEDDQTAFAAIMSSVSNASNAQAGNLNLNDTKLFTEGAVNDMYNDYLNNIDAVKGFYNENSPETSFNLNEGEVAILFIQKDGVTVITSSLPN